MATRNETPDLSRNRLQLGVERVRAYAGLAVVLVGDAAITTAAAIGVIKAAGTPNAGPVIVSMLTAAFTAVSTTTTAYFGIKAASNTAQGAISIAAAPEAPEGRHPNVPPSPPAQTP
ncbi:hypothetical protein [Streptomyces sp. NPDC046197]|uniref:hypothetical protein n=1 Tax=Streptomyces sp. NPDC046197 TaxID=3154337 RepID=UPI0033C8E76C